MKSGLLLNIVIAQGSSVLELLAGEDKTLLVRWNPLLVLNLGLHVVDGIRRLNFQRDGLTREGLDKDLHASAETKNQVKRGLLLNVVISKSTSVLKLFSGEDQALLIRGDSFFVLNLRLDIVDGIRGLDLKSNGLSSEGLDENLHTAAEAED